MRRHPLSGKPCYQRQHELGFSHRLLPPPTPSPAERAKVLRPRPGKPPRLTAFCPTTCSFSVPASFLQLSVPLPGNSRKARRPMPLCSLSCTFFFAGPWPYRTAAHFGGAALRVHLSSATRAAEKKRMTVFPMESESMFARPQGKLYKDRFIIVSLPAPCQIRACQPQYGPGGGFSCGPGRAGARRCPAFSGSWQGVPAAGPGLLLSWPGFFPPRSPFPFFPGSAPFFACPGPSSPASSPLRPFPPSCPARPKRL